MINKKTIILGLGVAAVLAGVVWWTGNNQEPADQAESPSIIENEFILGDLEAPVTMVEYSSHLCGHCYNFHKETLPLLIDEYIKNGQLKFIPRRLSPSEMGQALLCAQEQDKFSEFDDYLFENNQELIVQAQQATSEENLKQIVLGWLGEAAANLGLNQDNFNQCLNSNKYQARAANWFNQSEEAEVSGTPTFIINGEKLVGNQPYDTFKEAIEQALDQ